MNNRKTYIIAECGVNHNGSIEMAKKLVDAAVEAEVDAVKFQTFKAERIVTRTAYKAVYQSKTTDLSESQFEMIKKLELNEDDHKELFQYCRTREVQFLSSPFDIEGIDLLAYTLDLPRLKIPSGEITNAPLLLHAARSGKPVILSTGLSILGEIEMALGVLAFGYMKSEENPSLAAFKEAYCSESGQNVLRKNVVLLHCTTEYPAPFSDVNLRAMETLRSAFGLPVGYSDHTSGIAIPIAAVALGAVVIEKHLTLDRDLPGPDHKASLEPYELKQMVQSIRQVEQALGAGLKIPAKTEMRNCPIIRKSIVASKKIRKGEIFSEANISVKRPEGGVSPLYYWDFLGKRADKDYEQDEMIIT